MSWKKNSGSRQLCQYTEPTYDYPPQFMKHLSSCSLDRKPFKDFTAGELMAGEMAGEMLETFNIDTISVHQLPSTLLLPSKFS